ncbi:MAG: hypothetical protein Kow0022_17150 [Phycisphaerales bacterium]
MLSGSPTVRILQPEDFVPDVPAEKAPPAKWVPAPEDLAADPSADLPVVSVRPGPPATPTTVASPIETPVLIDSKIGDVNGKPIFATEFLEPLADRLKAEAAQMPPSRWEKFAKEQIQRRLEEIVTDELLRAEALSRLTPEQKQGFRAFLESMRGDLARESGGSSALARRRLAQEQGITEEEFIRQREQEQLIRHTIIREIESRVNISWRDIRQRYQRDWKVFNPPPTVTLRLIRIPTENTQAIEKVNQALAAGEPFDQVCAESESNYKPEEGGLDQFALEGPFEQAEFYGASILNEKAHALKPGEWTGPFELGSQTAWLKLESITTSSVSIYDAQLAIQERLTAERRNEELKRYMARLEKRASFTSLTEMRDRLYEIARERFGPPAGEAGMP